MSQRPRGEEAGAADVTGAGGRSGGPGTTTPGTTTRGRPGFRRGWPRRLRQLILFLLICLFVVAGGLVYGSWADDRAIESDTGRAVAAVRHVGALRTAVDFIDETGEFLVVGLFLGTDPPGSGTRLRVLGTHVEHPRGGRRRRRGRRRGVIGGRGHVRACSECRPAEGQGGGQARDATTAGTARRRLLPGRGHPHAPRDASSPSQGAIRRGCRGVFVTPTFDHASARSAHPAPP